MTPKQIDPQQQESGHLKSVKNHICCVFCNVECSKYDNCLYLLCFLQFGMLKSGQKLLFAVLFAMSRAQKCKNNIYIYIYIYLLCFLQLGVLKS